METVEVIVYMAIAVIIGALILGFISSWDAPALFHNVREMFHPTAQSYERVSATKFPRAVLDTWEGCGLGSKDANRTIYVADNVLLNKTALFASIKQANLCQSLQWADAGCGTRDDVSFSQAQGPTVLQLRCDAASRKLFIS